MHALSAAAGDARKLLEVRAHGACQPLERRPREARAARPGVPVMCESENSRPEGGCGRWRSVPTFASIAAEARGGRRLGGEALLGPR
jgi:hypothetical protein